MKRLFLVCIIFLLVLALSGCQKSGVNVPSAQPSTVIFLEKTVKPSDSLSVPARRFFMGVLPSPAEGQSFEDAYRQTAVFANFVPVWGRPTPFYNMAEELSGTWGQAFVEKYTRSNGMIPFVHISFFGANMTLASPADIREPALNNPEWRKVYKQSALEIVKAVRPLYFRWAMKSTAGTKNMGQRITTPTASRIMLASIKRYMMP